MQKIDNYTLDLSLIVITKNEAKNIHSCLKSALGLARELIVLDSGSTDGTQTVCRALGAKVVEADWPGFGMQKNRALELAKCRWILSLDADEMLSDGLREEIRDALSRGNDDISAYSMPRKSSYCGQFMKHSGWWPDRVVRLFIKSRARFTDSIVHEEIIFEGKAAKLYNPVIHNAVTGIDQSIDKMNSYSTASSIQLENRGVKGSVGKAVLKGLWAFFRTYILRLGILDGRMGFILSVANAEGVYYRHIKLWVRQRNGR